MTGIETRVDSQGATRYRAVVKDRGKLVRGSWRTSLADAKGDRIRMLAAKLDGPLRSDSESLSAASDRFLAGIESGTILSRKRKRYAPKTTRGYRQAFRDHINPELGHIRADKLRRSQVQRWVDGLREGLADGTVRNTWAALAALYAWLLPRHDDMVNPTDGVILPAPPEPRERFAEREEMAALLGVLTPTLALPYALAFYAGLRHGEIQSLRWEDVTDGWIHVQRSFDFKEGFVPPKSGKAREVPVLSPGLPYLASGGSGFVFPAKRASQWGVQMLGRSYSAKCEALWAAAGLESIGLHEARHSWVTAVVRSGEDVTTVQAWGGWSDPVTPLRIYSKAPARKAGAADRANAYLEARGIPVGTKDTRMGQVSS